MNNNKRKNTFATRIQVSKSSIKDLSQDIDESELAQDFERVLNGEETNDSYSKPKVVEKYLMSTIGTYSKEDITENFDFVLYDINNFDTNSLEDRRKRYMLHSSLSNNQLRKIDELNADEQIRLNQMLRQVDANLNQYKVNYTTDGKGTSYTDALGFDSYHSDTSNQISASVFEGKEFVYSTTVGIIGIGFNRETLNAEAIAISSNSYKTTNKGINNLEYDEEHEFQEMSSPFSELIKSRGQSEIVMHRRGMDFDTKASYIFVTIDSSNKEQTNEIMEQIKQLKEKEGLKVVIYDISKIRESLEKSKQE